MEVKNRVKTYLQRDIHTRVFRNRYLCADVGNYAHFQGLRRNPFVVAWLLRAAYRRNRVFAVFRNRKSGNRRQGGLTNAEITKNNQKDG